jgi:phosphatidate cytidylyltransferase
VTRVISGAVMVALAVAVVWFAPVLVLFAIAEVVLVLGVHEYAALAGASGISVPFVPAAVAAGLTLAALVPFSAARWMAAPLDIILLSALVALGVAALGLFHGYRNAIAGAAASLFPALYLGLPLGAMVAIREIRGRETLFLLMLAVFVSDTAQYYSGRAFGRRPLAPAISPKKTVEGALGGFVFGALVLTIVGAWWLPSVPAGVRALLGIALVAAGIAGDLFESMLKRSAGVKDSSGLIPGHGGILDRIDALLFAAPVYYVVLKYV